MIVPSGGNVVTCRKRLEAGMNKSAYIALSK